MKCIPPETLDYYDVAVIKLIRLKYAFDEPTALRAFIASETHDMLADSRMELWEFGPPGIFDMWECERITGDPRNSVYIRGDEVEVDSLE